MTYIVGARRGDVAAIYADTQLTSTENGIPPVYGGIKCGVMFPGCIYGVSGDWHAALGFIYDVQRAVEYLDNPAERWTVFEQVCTHRIDTHSSYQLLLSSRHLGRPRFYLFQSERNRLVEGHRDLYTLGSGTNLYNATVENFFENAYRNFNIGYPTVTDFEYPYFLGAVLHESDST